MPPRLLLFLVLFLTATSAQSRSLSWPSIIVDAQLDGNGLLHVAETQTFLFNGNWNGGERQFNIRAGQFLHLEGVDRIDGAQIVPLTRGDLAAVNQYALLEDLTLRWRSRLPEDPEFENTELTYRIRYTLSGVLRGRNNHFRLAHDFVFPEREGNINNFTLNFTLDPLWKGIESPLIINQRDLEPGKSVIVRGELEHLGPASPKSVSIEPPPWAGYFLLLLLATGMAALFLRFLAMERKAGRLGNLVPLEEIDTPWLEKNVLSMPPEVVGAAWDGKVGAAEIAAILATLEHDKKIKTSIHPRFLRQPTMAMELLVKRSTITGYHGSVINKLFYNNRVNTDTNAIKEHYKDRGLDLSAIIQKPIDQQLNSVPKWNEKIKPVQWQPSLIAMTVTFALLVITGVWGSGGNDGALASTAGFFGICSLALAAAIAHFHSRAISNLELRFGLVIAFVLPLGITTAYYLVEAPTFLFHVPVLIATVLWNFSVFDIVLNALRIDEAPEKIAFRKKLLSARNYFLKQLSSRTPDLYDSWFPYILAFGLGSNVDSWFRAYGKTEPSIELGSAISSSGTSFSGSSQPAWTGGGGSFGGAGASGSWAAAAIAVGTGVSSPGSSSGGSSSSGGGGGGGSSSGGGGGGGW